MSRDEACVVSTRPEEPDLSALAGAVGVRDAFVFRKVSSTQWVHLGGLGRGRGWAGLIDVDTSSDPLLADVPREPGGVRTFEHAGPSHVVGPYYAVSGATVRISQDIFVLLGDPATPGASHVPVEQLRELAFRLDAELEEIKPSKRLADDLEILHAVRAVTTGHAEDLLGTLQHILDVTAQSLSCEIGLLRDAAGHLVTTAPPTLTSAVSAVTSSTLDDLENLAAGSVSCVQDAAGGDPSGLLGRALGACSVLVLAMPKPVGGVIVVAHSTTEPRGFTSLCQELGRQIALAAGVVAHTAAMREQLRDDAAAHAITARRDALTGLGNRLSWDEALADFQDEVDAGRSATLITLDVDGLKELNDSCGHDAGDDLLRRCANTLRTHVRETDISVRLGGDEFAVLLPMVGALADARVATLREAFATRTSCQRFVGASLGSATVHPGGSVADAVREADAATYAAKRSRRAARTSPPR